jgi:hypothetical protein
MNCCQPWHFDPGAAPLQSEVEKGFVLSWSEKTLGTFEVGLEQFEPANVVPVSLVTLVTVSKDPVALDMRLGLVTSAA